MINYAPQVRLTQPEILEAIRQMGEIAQADQHGGFKRLVHRHLVQAGILDQMPYDDDLPQPFPAKSDITAIEVSIFDNWPTGKQVKSYPFRYGVSIKAWTVPAQNINFKKKSFAFKGNCTIYSAGEIVAKVAELEKKKLNHPLSEDYSGTIRAFAHGPMKEQGFVGGMLFKKSMTEGTFYYDHHMLMLDGDSLAARSLNTANLICGTDNLELAPFVTTGPKSKAHPQGKPLSGKCILQSRTTNDRWLRENWSTHA